MKCLARIHRFLVLALISFLSSFHAPLALGQSGKGTINGHVADPTGYALQGAKVALDGINSSVATDEQGNFSIVNLAPGPYKIRISYLGFAIFGKDVSVVAGQSARVEAILQVASENEQIVVTSDRPRGEAEAINRQETAENIVQVLTSDVITSLPNANIADAVGRLPSVTLERDEGEGKYVQIRGTEPRLTNVTIDGINIPSPEAGVRQIKLDTIPADLVESVEINKTLEANMDGDGIGGSVNLVTKTAEDRPTISFYGAGGYTPIVNGRKVVESSATVGKRFGASKKFGLLFGGHYDWNGRGIDDIEPVPDAFLSPSGALIPYYESMDIREYRYNRTRWGSAVSADYKISENSSIYMRGMYSDFKDYGDKWVYTINDNNPSPPSTLGAPNSLPADPGFSSSVRRPDYGIGSILAGGRGDLNSTWYAWDISVARSRQTNSAGNPGPDYAYTGADSQCTFNQAGTTNPNLPQWSPSCYAEAYNQANFSLQDIVLSYGKTAQLNLQFTGAVGKRYHIGSHLATIQVGGKFRNSHKFDDSYTLGYDPNLNLPNTMFLENFSNTNYYGGAYPAYGPVPSYYKILAYFRANPGNFTEESYDPNGNTTLGGNPNNFDLVEKVSAGYVMNTIDLGKFHLVAGLRVEGTNLFTSTFTTTQPSDPTLPPVNSFTNSTGSYVRILPSASLRYALTNSSAIRLVYSRGLSRPDPQDIAQAYSIDKSASPPTVTLGNPNLKAETANNYDLLFEKYLNSVGMFQAGFFYKQLYDPIVESAIPALESSGPYAGYLITQPVNIGHAWVGGFEVAYLQHYTSLPGLLRGLGLSANYSYTKSRAFGLDDIGRADHPALVRQAPHTWNISPTYDYRRFTFRLGMTYNDTNIAAYQYTDGTNGIGPSPFGTKGPFGDNYFYSHLQVDAQGSLRLQKGFTLTVYGLNLNNEVFGYYNGSPQFVVQREYYKQTIGAGLHWSPTHEK